MVVGSSHSSVLVDCQMRDLHVLSLAPATRLPVGLHFYIEASLGPRSASSVKSLVAFGVEPERPRCFSGVLAINFVTDLGMVNWPEGNRVKVILWFSEPLHDFSRLDTVSLVANHLHSPWHA